MIKIAPQTIDALAMVISGGGANDGVPSIGLYRSGPKLESFMRRCGVTMSVGSGSRVPTLIEAILTTVESGNEDALKQVIERAADPRDFVTVPEKMDAVLRHLNSYLVYDGYELQVQGSVSRLVKKGTSAAVISTLSDRLAIIDFDTVQRDLDRALASAGAILGGINSTIQGIGALRTHGGDAHGRERGFRRVDARIARLAIHTASGVALFIIETWQKEHPAKKLHAR